MFYIYVFWMHSDEYFQSWMCNLLKANTPGFSLHSLNRLCAISCFHHGNHTCNIACLTIHSVSLHCYSQYVSPTRLFSYVWLSWSLMWDYIFWSVNKNINICLLKKKMSVFFLHLSHVLRPYSFQWWECVKLIKNTVQYTCKAGSFDTFTKLQRILTIFQVYCDFFF